MNYQNVELTIKDAATFSGFLKANGITYETSQADNLIHFEVLVSDATATACNDFLAQL